MTQTQTYKLPQWEKSDRIVMEDFNGQAAKIEAVLTAHDDALAQKADKTTTSSLQTQINQKAAASALNSAVSALETKIEAKCTVVIGTYQGDGAASRIISLGFTPKALLVSCTTNGTQYSGDCFGGLVTPGIAAHSSRSVGLKIVDGGFEVYNYPASSVYTNGSAYRFVYLAFR